MSREQPIIAETGGGLGFDYKTQCYTGSMTDGCGCLGKPQAREITRDVAEAVVKGRQERQVVLSRVRWQRVLVLKRLMAKYDR